MAPRLMGRFRSVLRGARRGRAGSRERGAPASRRRSRAYPPAHARGCVWSRRLEARAPLIQTRACVEMTSSLMTAGEVADLLGVPISWVYEQSRRGRIPTVSLGRYRRYRREAIDEWIVESELHGDTAGTLRFRGRP